MVGKPTATQMLARMADLHVRVELPTLLPGGGVKRDHVVVHAAQIKRIADLQRRDLEGGFVRVARPLRVTRVEGPCAARAGPPSAA